RLPARERQGGGGAPPDRPRWRLGAGGNARRGGDVRAAVAAVALPTPVGRGRPRGRARLPHPRRASPAAATRWARPRGPPPPPEPVLGARRRVGRPAAGPLRPERDGGRCGPAHA